jgi:ATP-dependent exoDNAse (exonuclease V) beta subunit
MTSALEKNSPPDNAQRERALNASRSILVHAPAGSGKTDLLTRRYLLLLGQVDDPGEIAAITFTKAAAAEMRHRILSQLEEAAASSAPGQEADLFSTEYLARRALAHSQARGWNLLDLPSQLRIQTIDSFCRELALQQPLLSGLGGGLDISEQPSELYRRAARHTLEQIDSGDPGLRKAIEKLLLWRDNNWQDLEQQLVAMLGKRDQWMHDFVLDRDPDWIALRAQLEAAFAREVRNHLTHLVALLKQVPGAHEEAHELARFACEQSGGQLHSDLAELAEFPAPPFASPDALEDARQAYACLADLVLTGDGAVRRQANINRGFPKEYRSEKARLLSLFASLDSIPELAPALAAVRTLPPARYSDEEWEIVKACFTLLRHAAAQLRVVFAETASADYIEVAQIALKVLQGDDGGPANATLAVADRVRHLLVDEFQDTSRRQHQLLAHLIAAWPDRDGRTCFVVGDPKQSIYFFRDADAELFPRVEQLGLEIPGDQPLLFDSVHLTANFRSAAPLIENFNSTFGAIFASDDGSGITYTAVQAAREAARSGLHLVPGPESRMHLHLEFIPQTRGTSSTSADVKEAIAAERDAACRKQIAEIVNIVRDRLPDMDRARAAGEKYRIAVLGRARKSLAPIAQALREAGVPFRALDLEELQQRPEIMDALSLARALLNPQDRVAWLGVLRAPWCGLSLADLHALTSGDDKNIMASPIPQLLSERARLLGRDGRIAVARVSRAADLAARLRSQNPNITLGTWLEQVWLQLGGAQCVDAVALANLNLLWSTLDRLPEGEADLLGPAIADALSDLKAMPDPDADSDCGVQLMTIHGAKGLEFEVVIVPDLQADSGRDKHEILSWLERALPPDAGSSGAPTEFLVAPVQSKGFERGKAKAWVDRVRREREKQEMRRLFYVAVTRAREAVHLLARPTYKSTAGRPMTLAEPCESLLKTAWPALEAEVRRRFNAWRATAPVIAAATPLPAEPAEIASIAASGSGYLFEILPQTKLTLLRRLPADFRLTPADLSSAAAEAPIFGESRLYERHEGGLASRALGRAVHALFQKLAELRAAQSWELAAAALPRFQASIAADVRASGVDAVRAGRIAAEALKIVLRAAGDPLAKWILAPHPDAASEVRWSGIIEGRLRVVQVDRVFRAGHAPQSDADSSGVSAWWIIDYKTAHEEGVDPTVALAELRRVFAPQIEAYASVLRNLHGASAAVFGGLYYPRMAQFDWWKI